MNPFATGELGPALETFLLQQLAQCQCRIGDETPGDAVSRVQIEHHLIGALDVVDGRVPGMYLDDAHFREADEAVEIFDPESGAFAARSFGDLQLPYTGRHAGQRT